MGWNITDDLENYVAGPGRIGYRAVSDRLVLGFGRCGLVRFADKATIVVSSPVKGLHR